MDAHQNPIVTAVNFRTLSTLLLSPLALYPVVSAVALGSSVYVTFINGPIQYYNLPRKVFGDLQSKQFPAFFTLQTVTSAMLFASYWACTPHRLAFQTSKFDLSNARVFNGYLVSIMLASAIGNLVYAGPKATGIMQSRHRLQELEGKTYDAPGEKSPRMAAINAKFAVAHSVSSLLNLAFLGAAVIHQGWMGRFGFSG